MSMDLQNSTASVLITGDMTNSATQTANLDCRGAAAASIILTFAAEVNTNAVAPTLSLLESDDTVVTNFATFDSDFENSSIDLTAAACAAYHVDLRGRKRYLRLSVTTATTTNDDIEVHAAGVLYRKTLGIASTTDMADLGAVG